MSENEDSTTNGGDGVTDTTHTEIPELSFTEARVLGCLLEKEATTPDNYPLTLNSLHSACNQSTNRHPVTELDTGEVEEALEELRYKKLALLVHQSGARVPKFKHTLEQEFPSMTRSQQALICVLLLRGQQTASELRQRTERMHPFKDLDAVENQLQNLIDNQPKSLAQRIPAGEGRRAETFIQLLCAEQGVDIPSSVSTESKPSTSAPNPPSARIDELETEVTQLKQTVFELRAELDEVKQQLGI